MVLWKRAKQHKARNKHHELEQPQALRGSRALRGDQALRGGQTLRGGRAAKHNNTMPQTNRFSTSYSTIESIRPDKEAQLVNASSDSSSRQVGCGYASEFRVTSKPSAQTESITTTHCHSLSLLSTHKPHLTIDTNKQTKHSRTHHQSHCTSPWVKPVSPLPCAQTESEATCRKTSVQIS